MKAKSAKDSGVLWESGVAKKAFFIRSHFSLAFRIIYLVFSLYWMYRWYVLGASYIFLVMGLFFLLTSAYLLFFPLAYADKQRYLIVREGAEDVLVVPGFLWRAKRIPLKAIEKVEDRSSKIDLREGCKSFEIEYNDGELDYHELLAVSNHKGLPEILSDGKARAKINASANKREPANKQRENSKRSAFEMAMIAGIILLLILISYTAYTKIADKKKAEGNVVAAQDGSGPFLFTIPTGSIGAGEDLAVGVFGIDSEGKYSYYDCCAPLPNKPGPIEYPYFGNNQTIFLASIKTYQPFLEISSEYIKEVYLCMREGDVPKSKEIISYFGNESIEESNCGYEWISGRCCMRWHAP